MLNWFGPALKFQQTVVYESWRFWLQSTETFWQMACCASNHPEAAKPTPPPEKRKAAKPFKRNAKLDDHYGKRTTDVDVERI